MTSSQSMTSLRDSRILGWVDEDVGTIGQDGKGAEAFRVNER